MCGSHGPILDPEAYEGFGRTPMADGRLQKRPAFGLRPYGRPSVPVKDGPAARPFPWSGLAPCRVGRLGRYTAVTFVNGSPVSSIDEAVEGEAPLRSEGYRTAQRVGAVGALTKARRPLTAPANLVIAGPVRPKVTPCLAKGDRISVGPFISKQEGSVVASS